MNARRLGFCLAYPLWIGAALAQAPVISSFNRDGELVCTNLLPGTTAAIEWAPNVSGPWTDSWSGLSELAVGSSGTVQADVPRFFRVRTETATLSLKSAEGSIARSAPTNPVVMIGYDLNGKLVCEDLQPDTAANAEWASSLWGPWTNTWQHLNLVRADSNGMIRVVLPMFVRVRGIPENIAQTNLVWIPAGTFMMGSPSTEQGRDPDEGPETQVTISRGFWMGRFEVMQAEYSAIVGTNPSYFTNGSLPFSGVGGMVTNEALHPVDSVSWDDATNYCARLSEREITSGRLHPKYAYQLPTEAEWEYACRAGGTTPFCYGTELRSGMANFDGKYEYPPCLGADLYCFNTNGVRLGRTAVVGNYAASQWGLYDIHGNVREWCHNFYTWPPESYPGGVLFDPRGPETGTARVLRGGSYYRYATLCRAAYRYYEWSGYRANHNGFRLVLKRSRNYTESRASSIEAPGSAR